MRSLMMLESAVVQVNAQPHTRHSHSGGVCINTYRCEAGGWVCFSPSGGISGTVCGSGLLLGQVEARYNPEGVHTHVTQGMFVDGIHW